MDEKSKFTVDFLKDIIRLLEKGEYTATTCSVAALSGFQETTESESKTNYTGEIGLTLKVQRRA